MNAVAATAIASEDTDAVFSVIRTISALDDEETAESLEDTFLASIAYMERQREPRWVNGWWSRRRSRSSLLDLLSEEEAKAVLGSLLDYEEFGTRLESLLAGLAATKPQVVVAYLSDRVRSGAREARRAGFSPLPHRLRDLGKALKPYPTVVLQKTRALFAEESGLFRHRGGKLVEIIYPAFSPELEGALHAFIETGSRDDVAFVVDVLCTYSGQAFIHPLCKATIAALSADDPLLQHVEAALEQMGVTSGAFGRVNVLRERREAIAQWTEDDREAVQKFAASFLYHLDQMIVAEQRRSVPVNANKAMHVSECCLLPPKGFDARSRYCRASWL